MIQTLFIILIIWFIIGIAFLILLQEKQTKFPTQTYTKSNKSNISNVSSIVPFDFVPIQDPIVPTHASQTNKLNNELGNKSAAFVGPAFPEIVVHSDWYQFPYLPTEFDGPYWAKGSIEYDYIYPGSDPQRPLRSSRQSSQRGIDLVGV